MLSWRKLLAGPRRLIATSQEEVRSRPTVACLLRTGNAKSRSSLSDLVRNIPTTAIKSNEKQPQSIRPRHYRLRLAVVALWRDLTDHDPVAFIIFFPENSAILFIDGFGRAWRVSNELCDLSECFSDKGGTPIVTDRCMCSLNNPWRISICESVVCIR